jgi:vancomycin resistance protein YoaR
LAVLGTAWLAPDAVAAEKKGAKAEASDKKAAKAGLSKAELRKLDVLARFSTKLGPGEARAKNIKRIAQLMDGVVIEPGRSFSVNHFVGARTEDKGFVLAASTPDQEYTETLGGGVSQFATTLYNALYEAGFPILEHKPHGHYASRYPAGLDATLGWPGPDLSFKNDSESQLVIKSSVSNGQVSVKLLGHTPRRKVERKRVELDLRAPTTELVGDATLSHSKQKVERAGTPRRSLQVTRVVTSPGKRRVDEVVVTYAAQKRVLRVHPCMLPNGHKDYTGEPCGKAKATKAKKTKKPSDE